MHPGDFVHMKNLCSEIGCLSLIGSMIHPLLFWFIETAARLAAAVAAKEAAAARLILASNQLAECRENNNPYNWMGQPTRAAMFGPDPCLEQERERHEADQAVQAADQRIAGATTSDIAAIQAGAASNAPSVQDLASAPAPQLATGYDPVGITDPSIPLSEYSVPSPGMQSLWSPLSIDAVMEMILDEMEWEKVEEEVRQKVLVILDGLVENMDNFGKWWSWGKGPKSLKIKFKPKNQKWIGMWSP